MSTKTNWNQSELDREMKRYTKTYLEAAGEAGQNQFAQSAPVLEGTLKNSMSYETDEGKTGKINGYPGKPATNADRVSKPIKKDTVRFGSGLIYAARREEEPTSTGSEGWATRAWDALRASKAFERLLKKVGLTGSFKFK